jgi:hypothetical protein
MAHPTLPQLVHVPAEGPAAGTEALQSRPAGGASQSAAEATLGLVTVDILGLAGTGVPPEAGGQVQTVVRGSLAPENTANLNYPGLIMHAQVNLFVVGVMAITSEFASIPCTNVTVDGVSLTSLGPGGLWWWQTRTPAAQQQSVTLGVTAAAVAEMIVISLGEFRDAAPPPGQRAGNTGVGPTYAVALSANPSGPSLIIDQGWCRGASPTVVPLAGQTIHYFQNQTIPSPRQWFGSGRPWAVGGDSLSMSWTGPNVAWRLEALVIPAL